MRTCDVNETPDYVLGGLLNHVVTVPSGNWDESNSLGVITDLLDEVGSLLDNFVESALRPLQVKTVRYSARDERRAW
jgi:hypothetical protein